MHRTELYFDEHRLGIVATSARLPQSEAYMTSQLDTIARRARPSSALIICCLVAISSLNLAWEHQVILTQMVKVNEYYEFAARAPFIYRILPAFICRLVFLGRANAATGLPVPLDSYYSVFQLALDAICLATAFVFMARITRQLNPDLPNAINVSVAGAAALMIVVFGYFMVPNNAYFYPYDFPDLCIAAMVFFLCITAGRTAEILLPAAVYVATLNKETAAFYTGLYLIVAIQRHSNWKRVAIVLLACVAAAILARATILFWLRRHGLDSVASGSQAEVHLSYTIQQIKNPLFLFSLMNICSYLYLPVWAMRKRFDRTDWLILALILGWLIIVATFGIVRQLRLYVPASLLLFVIIARHLSATIATLEPRFAPALARLRGDVSPGGRA
jgi:hypothetical protein